MALLEGKGSKWVKRKGKWSVINHTVSGWSHILKSGFKTIEDAQKYIAKRKGKGCCEGDTLSISW